MQFHTISISWAEGSTSSVQPSSNGSWFCPMRCLISTPSFFLGSTGQGVQQASTGCSQVNPEMPLLWQRLATSISEAMHVTAAWNQVTNLALSASYGNEPWKDKKCAISDLDLLGYHGEGSTDPFRNWMRWLIVCGKDKYQACTNCSGAWWRLLLCVRCSMIWRSKFRFKIEIWRGSEKYSIQNALLKLWSLKPATCTQPAQLSLSETNCCCHLLPTSTELLPVAVNPEFISVPRRSASSFNSNTDRSCEGSPQFGWVWSNLHGFATRMHKWVDCWLRQCSASTRNMSWGGMKMQVAHLGRPIRLKTRCHSSSFCYHVESLIASCNFHFGWVCVLAKWSCIFPKRGWVRGKKM